MFEAIFLSVIPGLTRNPGTYRKNTGFPVEAFGNEEKVSLP
jgi:hypothetical protein